MKTEDDTFRHLTRRPFRDVVSAWVERSGTIPSDELNDLTMEYGWTLEEFYAQNRMASALRRESSES